MKNMVIFMLLLMICVTIWGQDTEEYRKPVILVNTFVNAGKITKSEAETFRNSFVAKMSRMERIQVVDILSEKTLSEETKRRLREETLSDELARSGEMRQLGANYILDGAVSDVVVTKNEHKKKKENGTYEYSYSYTAKLTYSLKLISTEDGTLEYSESYSTSSTKNTQQEAYSTVFTTGSLGCDFLNEVAPLTGKVIDTDYTVKKDKLYICYVTIGAKKGIKRNDYLTVTGVKYIAGEAIQERIGSLRVIETYDNISRCKVDSEAKELLSAMKEYLKMKTMAPESAQPLLVKTQCGSDRTSLWPL
jgi:hypothetical protein